MNHIHKLCKYIKSVIYLDRIYITNRLLLSLSNISDSYDKFAIMLEHNFYDSYIYIILKHIII